MGCRRSAARPDSRVPLQEGTGADATAAPLTTRVQAVLALREILLSRWALLGQQAQQATLHFLLGLALGPLAADPRPLLRTQVGAVVACKLRGESGAVPIAVLAAGGRVWPPPPHCGILQLNCKPLLLPRVSYCSAGQRHSGSHHKARLAGGRAGGARCGAARHSRAGEGSAARITCLQALGSLPWLLQHDWFCAVVALPVLLLTG